VIRVGVALMIDCDVHQDHSRLDELAPWLDPEFRRYFDHGTKSFSMPVYPWINPVGVMRDDAIPAGGGVPGSDYELVRDQLLDRLGLEYAILNGGDILTVGALPDAAFATALARAYNRWLIEVWLSRDRRFRGSLVVAPQDSAAAAKEIRTQGAAPGIVQVLLPLASEAGYGQSRYLPIFEAAVELGLPVALHPAGGGLGLNPPPTSAGYPSFYIELHSLFCEQAMSQLVSLLCHGVFERLPDLHLVMVETGVLWVPGIVWRLDGNWRALRSEVPWMTQLPSETVRSQVWFTTQPLEEPPSIDQLRSGLELVDGAADRLLFATDYPHWNADEPGVVEKLLPPGWRRKVMAENARKLYRLPQAETSASRATSGADVRA
jgi:predicted TIM-barrel fold metal-dependent hydrolase